MTHANRLAREIWHRFELTATREGLFSKPMKSICLVFLLLTLVGCAERSALEKLERAAERGDRGAQFHLGLMYSEGNQTSKDYQKAAWWFRMAAEQGYVEAQYNLGGLYADGRGVPKDYEEALRWFRMAAEQGNADAQTSLGLAYAEGQGVPRDYEESVRWFRMAAEQGNADAQTSLGLAYADGLGGVPVDDEEAARWWRMAAEQGNADAQAGLFMAYRYGLGVPRNDVLALKWLNLLAITGDEEVVEIRNKFREEMLPEEIAEAQRRSRKMHEKIRARNP